MSLRFPRPDGIVADLDAGALTTRKSNVIRVLVLLFIMPLFGQSFYYLLPLAPLYYLSKAWPLIVLPVSLWALMQLQLPGRSIYITMLAYTIGFTPLMSMLHLGAGFFDSLVTTVKIWPFTYYFSLVGILVWLRPSPKQLENVILSLGIATFVIMAVMWVVVPANWYTIDATNSKLFIHEAERGNRIYMPMFFGYLLLFYFARRFANRRDIMSVIAILVGFALLIFINKQRTSITAAALVVLVSACPRRWRSLAIAGAGFVICVVIAIIPLTPTLGSFADSLGNSLLIRQQSLDAAFDFLGDDALRWLFGIGATTRFSSVRLADIFRNENFFLADIGWVGVVFEFGIAGAFLLAAVYVKGLITTTRAGAAGENAFAQALGNYVLFMIVTSAVYSVVFTPGELATVVALSVYIAGYAANQDQNGAGWAAPNAPRAFASLQER